MNWVKDLFTYLSDFFKWWVVILPWQEGIRVRLGKRETHLKKGIYLRIPIIDSVFVQGVRLVYDQIPIMTIATKDKHVVTINGAIAFQITDIVKLYHSISNPKATLSGIAMSKISAYITSHDLADCNPLDIENNVTFEKGEFGLEAEIKITGFAPVRTFRLIQDHTWMPTSKEHEI